MKYWPFNWRRMTVTEQKTADSNRELAETLERVQNHERVIRILETDKLLITRQKVSNVSHI